MAATARGTCLHLLCGSWPPSSATLLRRRHNYKALPKLQLYINEHPLKHEGAGSTANSATLKEHLHILNHAMVLLDEPIDSKGNIFGHMPTMRLAQEV